MLAQKNLKDWLHQIDAESQLEALVKLKTQITNEVESFEMIQERKSYLLHQLANCRDLPSLVELIRDINLAQLIQKPTLFLVKNEEQMRPFQRDLLYIEISSEGPVYKTEHL